MTVKELYLAAGGSYEAALGVLQNDGLIRRFLVRFSEDDSFPRLVRAAESGDAQEIFQAAHSLKGVCGNLGLGALAAAASEITEAFRPGNPGTMDRVALEVKIAEMEALYERTLALIRELEN